MINIKTEKDLVNMREACRLTKETLLVLEKAIKPGITTKQLDKIAYDFIKSQGAVPAFKNYNGYFYNFNNFIFIKIR